MAAPKPPCRRTQPRVQFAGCVFDRATSALYREGIRVHLQEQPSQVPRRTGGAARRDRHARRPARAVVEIGHVRRLRARAQHRSKEAAARARRFRRYAGVHRDAATPRLPVHRAGQSCSGRRHGDRAGQEICGRRYALVRTSAAWVTAVGMVVLVAALAWRAQSRPAPPSRDVVARTTTQLAVMPFRVLGNPEKPADYLGIGIADAITTRLAGTRQIGVRPTSAVLPFQSSTNPAEVAAALAVEHVLVGTIQPTPQGYRVTVQLVKPDGVAVWGRSYDQAPAELLSVQDHIAEQVVSALRIELAAPNRARLHVRYTNNPEAYDHYLRGRSLLLDYTESNMRSAIEHFERALEARSELRAGSRRHRHGQRVVQRSLRASGGARAMGQASRRGGKTRPDARTVRSPKRISRSPAPQARPMADTIGQSWSTGVLPHWRWIPHWRSRIWPGCGPSIIWDCSTRPPPKAARPSG